MAKIFSIASWNVARLRDEPANAERIVDFLSDHRPDLFALYDVRASDVFDALMTKMPGYTFQITDRGRGRDILIGVTRQLTAFISQRASLRPAGVRVPPGPLVVVRIGGLNHAVLFLHPGSSDDMVERALVFRDALVRRDLETGGDGNVRYLIVGHFHEAIADDAIDTSGRPMRRLARSHDRSWSTDGGDSNRDQVFASDALNFRVWQRQDGTPAEVKVTGWTDFRNAPGKDKWIRDHGSHSLVYLEVIE